jgi:hypothetical protein
MTPSRPPSPPLPPSQDAMRWHRSPDRCLSRDVMLAPRITLTPPITSSLPLSSSASAANIQNQEFSQPSESAVSPRRFDSSVGSRGLWAAAAPV